MVLRGGVGVVCVQFLLAVDPNPETEAVWQLFSLFIWHDLDLQELLLPAFDTFCTTPVVMLPMVIAWT